MGEGRLFRCPWRWRRRLALVAVGVVLASGCGSSGEDGAVERERESPLVDGSEFVVSSKFAVAGRNSFNHVEASETHLLGFGGFDRTGEEVLLRTAGELVDLVDGTSTELTFPVVDGSTFFPYGARGLGSDFVLVGHLCSSPGDVYDHEFEGDPCAPRVPAAFLLRADGTWEEMSLPEELRSSRVAGVRMGRSGDGVVVVLSTEEDEDGEGGESVILRLSDGAWRVVGRIPDPNAYSCATATHLYRFVAGTEDETSGSGGATTSRMFRHDLRDGEEEEVALPELSPDLDGSTVGLVCNDAFPLLTTDVVDGVQTLYAYADERWTTVEGVLAGEEPSDVGELISHPRGMIIPMQPVERGSSDGERYFLVGEDMQVAELPAGQLVGQLIRRAGDARFLALVRNWDSESEDSPTADRTKTIVRVLAF